MNNDQRVLILTGSAYCLPRRWTGWRCTGTTASRRSGAERRFPGGWRRSRRRWASRWGPRRRSRCSRPAESSTSSSCPWRSTAVGSAPIWKSSIGLSGLILLVPMNSFKAFKSEFSYYRSSKNSGKSSLLWSPAHSWTITITISITKWSVTCHRLYLIPNPKNGLKF